MTSTPMFKNSNFVYNINTEGLSYYHLMRKDTFDNMVYAGPFVLFSLSFFFTLIFNFNWSILFPLYFILFLFVLFIFYFIPLILRGRSVNKIISKIEVDDDSIIITTLNWYNFKTRIEKLNDINDLGILKDVVGFRNIRKNWKYFFISDFYDSSDEIIEQLNKHN